MFAYMIHVELYIFWRNIRNQKNTYLYNSGIVHFWVQRLPSVHWACLEFKNFSQIFIRIYESFLTERQFNENWFCFVDDETQVSVLRWSEK